MDVRKIFEYALQREREGKRFFEENAARMKHATVIGVFRGLAEEEGRHIEFIEKQLAALDGGATAVELGAKLEKEGFFSQRAASEVLDQTVVEAMVPDLPVLRTAYLIERDFAEYYGNAAKTSKGDARRVLEMLAEWERGHEKLFKDLHDRAFAEYSGMPWGG